MCYVLNCNQDNLKICKFRILQKNLGHNLLIHDFENNKKMSKLITNFIMFGFVYIFLITLQLSE